MPQIQKLCDVSQGFHHKQETQTTVGFITKLTIGGDDLTADILVKNPLRPADDLQVVAVVSDLLWELEVTDAVYVTGRLLVRNRQTIMARLIGDITNSEIRFQLTVYEFDPVSKAYFKCFHVSDTDMLGALETNGSDLNLSLSDEPSREVPSPLNYTFYIGIKPQPTAQTITLAISPTKEFVKSWGLEALQ